MRALRPAAQQVVSIARALSHDVGLLIMDEPSAILDDDEVETLFGVVRRLKAEGVGVVYISHRLDEIPRIGDRVTVLSDGRTVATGLPADTPQGVLVEHMVGRKVEQLLPRARVGRDRRRHALGARRLAARRWSRRRASRCARARCSASAAWSAPGAPSCCGSSTGSTGPTRARSTWTASASRAGKPAAAIAAGLGLAPEDRKSQGLLLDWSLTKNVTLADLGRFRRGPLLNGGGERDAAARAAARAQHRARRSATGSCASSRAATSRRSCSRAGCCASARCCCSTSPRAASTSAPRPRSTSVIADLAREGLGVVVVSSELSELAGLCTRVLVMREGELVAEVAGAEATELELLRHAVAPTDTEPVIAGEEI